MTNNQQVQKWADSSMFTAEKSVAADGPKAYLLGGPTDPLGQIAACAKMYKGEVVRDLRDVTDDERREYLREIQKTALKMPLEAVSLHFMLEGVHRGITHQMVRQRTAAFAQESTRFAVKEDLATATALPPSLEGTLSYEEYAAKIRANGTGNESDAVIEGLAIMEQDQRQANRFTWDEAIQTVHEAYMTLVDHGVPAEDARGLMPTNITTRLNYITNLRNFYDTMAVRVSDQAQFEWRKVAMAYALAMREFGRRSEYQIRLKYTGEFNTWESGSWRGAINDYPGFEEIITSEPNDDVLIAISSEWQYVALTQEIKPIEFRIGGPAFGANFDRPSRIGERVRAYAHMGVPSSRWTQGAIEYNIPAIHPEEWLLDPNSARLDDTQEFDIWGNRVPKGTGDHWEPQGGGTIRDGIPAFKG